MTPPTAEQVTAALAWFRAHPAAVDCIGADMPEPYADDHAITLVRAALAAPAEQPREDVAERALRVAGDALDQLWTDAEIHGVTPGIEEQMRAASDRWRSVRGDAPPDGQAPAPLNGLTVEDVLDIVAPYLTGEASTCECPDSFRDNSVPVPYCLRHTVGPRVESEVEQALRAAAPADDTAPPDWENMRERLHTEISALVGVTPREERTGDADGDLIARVRAAVRPADDTAAPDAAPRADWSGAWAQLTGYVRAATGPIDPALIDAYMVELKREALRPFREWVEQAGAGQPVRDSQDGGA